MSLVGFKGQNHPQQVGKRGAKPEVDNLETPWDFFEPLNDRFDFTLDAAALPRNAKCVRYYAPEGTPREAWDCIWAQEGECGVSGCAGCEDRRNRPLAFNGLEQSWAGERVWCNPPYSEIGAWVEKAWQEHRNEWHPERAKSIVMLLPANRTEQGWWQEQVEPYRDGRSSDAPRSFRVEFLPGRLRFIKHGHDKVEPNQRPPFGCCLLIWGTA